MLPSQSVLGDGACRRACALLPPLLLHNLGHTPDSFPTPGSPVQVRRPRSGNIQTQRQWAAPAASGPQIPATCLAPPHHHLRPRLNSLPGPVPLAPAPGCSLLAFQAHLYVLAAAEFWGRADITILEAIQDAGGPNPGRKPQGRTAPYQALGASDAAHGFLKGQDPAASARPGAWHVDGACNVHPQGQEAHIPRGGSGAASGHGVPASRWGGRRKTPHRLHK